jgi:HK97 family phage prohead protease
MRFIISDESVNRFGYRILSKGMSTLSFEKNPVVFYNHGTYNLPIGKGKDLRHEADGSITLDIDFDQEDGQALAVQKKAEAGYLSACSVGIEVLETSTKQDVLLAGQSRPTVTRSELLELSICGIPGNRNALRLHAGHQQDMEQILPRMNPKKELSPKQELSMKHLKTADLPQTTTQEDRLPQTAGQEDYFPSKDQPATAETLAAEPALQLEHILADLKSIRQQLATLTPSTNTGGENENKLRIIDVIKEVRNQATLSTKEEMSWASLQRLSNPDFEEFRSTKRETYNKLYQAHYGFEPTW